MNSPASRLLPVLLTLCAACGRSPAPALPEINDPPKLARVVRADLFERAPAYGVAVGRGTALRLEVSVEAEDSGRVIPGQTAEAYVIPSSAAVACRVERVLRSASAETGQAIAWLKPVGPAPDLAPNDFVYARITTRVRRRALTAPAAAIMVAGGKTIAVRAEGEAKKPSPVAVVVGGTDGDRVEIVSGLSEGDEVVVEGGLGSAFPDFKAGEN